MKKQYLVNNQIRAEIVRVIDKEGKQLGIFKLEEALELARGQNLDLILITDKANPPVCKIADYGKFLYEIEKKERHQKGKQIETKTIRLTFNISLHDLQIKANQAEKFLKEGNRVAIEMVLKGREKIFEDKAKEKIEEFLKIMSQRIELKIDDPLRKIPKGFIIIISKKKNGGEN
ncbi:translation initiation factor IF-3 [Candidatus Parcubacteria bacterium]|nr:translation initiation factor IF-3 [Candidatus Parcubacteria bacterium]